VELADCGHKYNLNGKKKISVYDIKEIRNKNIKAKIASLHRQLLKLSRKLYRGAK